MKVIVFDVASSFGFFRKGFSTTNALTYAVIPRSAVEGLVGAILGLSRTDFPEILQSSKIAVELLSSVRKLNMKYMHINPKWWNETLSDYIKGVSYAVLEQPEQMAVPASVEVLVNPSYRIYIDTNNEKINNELAQNLMNKQSYYTPFLGTSSMIASIKYMDKFEYNYSRTSNYLPVSSIIPYSNSTPATTSSLSLKEVDLAVIGMSDSGLKGVSYTAKPQRIDMDKYPANKSQINLSVKKDQARSGQYTAMVKTSASEKKDQLLFVSLLYPIPLTLDVPTVPVSQQQQQNSLQNNNNQNSAFLFNDPLRNMIHLLALPAAIGLIAFTIYRQIKRSKRRQQQQ